MTGRTRTLLLAALLVTPAIARGQEASDDRGWSFSQRFQGSSNAAGVVLKTSSTAEYAFNRHVRVYAGFPVYFAKETAASGSSKFMNGVGNVYSGLFVTAQNSVIRYSSDLVATAPTGDKSRGFSTGHPTVDWTNTFSHSFARFTPYASIGAANTISDTSFFVRPFSSKGVVAHYEAGAVLDANSHVSFGASGYGVHAAGEQQIVSKVVEVQPESTTPVQQTTTCTPGSSGSSSNGALSGIGSVLGNNGNSSTPGVCTTTTSGGKRIPAVFETRQETLGPAEVANDKGVSTWVTLRPNRMTDFQIGYSRSTTYQFNSLFFGVGFRVGH